MKVLTLTQPWATLVALGEKKIETRSWSTSYRGILAIHAAKSFPRDCRELCHTEPFREVLGRHGLEAGMLPLGVILCVTMLTDIFSTEDVGPNLLRTPRNPFEFDFGDYSARRYAFMLGPVARTNPIPARGALGIWNFDREVI